MEPELIEKQYEEYIKYGPQIFSTDMGSREGPIDATVYKQIMARYQKLIMDIPDNFKGNASEQERYYRVYRASFADFLLKAYPVDGKAFIEQGKQVTARRLELLVASRTAEVEKILSMK